MQTTVDRALAAFVRSRRDEIVEFARELVATPSPNPPGDERAVAELVAAKLRELGVDRIETVGPSDDRPNVLAHAGGSGGRPLILGGPLDPKPPGALPNGGGDPSGALAAAGGSPALARAT